MNKKILFVLIFIIIAVLFLCITTNKDYLVKYSNVKTEKFKTLNSNDDEIMNEEGTQSNPWDISATEDNDVKAWLSEDGTLTIYGTGNMKDFSYNTFPWKDKYERITTINISEGITNIGNYAFYGCINTKEIKIPDSVTQIGSWSCNRCNAVKNINISKNVLEIKLHAFDDCRDLVSILADEENPNYTSVDGVLFNKNQSKLIQYPTGKTNQEYYIPNGVLIIGESAFARSRKLVNVYIPYSVQTVEYDCFYNCDKLENIIADQNNHIFTSENGILFSKNKDTLIQYPTAKSNEKYIIPEGVITISEDAFAKCCLKEIVFPKTVDEIKRGVFYKCDNLSVMYAYCGTYAEKYIKEYSILLLETIHDNEEIIIEPTCTEQGYTEHRCTRCDDNYKDNYQEALGHIYGEIVVEPTCTEQGYTEHRCSRCNNNYKDNYQEALDHSYREWIVDKDATKLEEGHRYRICTRCSISEEEIIPKLYALLEKISKKYDIYENKYVLLMKEIDNVEFKKSIDNLDNNEVISFENLTNEGKLKTGTKITCNSDNDEYIVVLFGDVNEDGNVSFDDVLGGNSLRGKEKEINKVTLLSTDLNRDGEINFSEILAINSLRTK